MKSVAKKVMLVASLILNVLLVFIIFAQETFCYDTEWCRNYWEGINSAGEVLLAVAPLLLIFSLITFRMKEEIFRRWFKFTLWYVPLLVIAIFVFPTDYPGGFGPGPGYHEALNILILTALFLTYIITSILKIVRSRKNILS